MKMLDFKGQGGRGRLSLGATEGGGAPMLLIKDGARSVGFVFDDPSQVRALCEALEPFLPGTND